jgi:hypothetical protein
MKPHLELKEKLEKLSKLEHREFTFEMSNHKLEYGSCENDYDFSIVTVKTKSTWLDLDTIKGIGGLKLSLYDDTITALFSITYYN